MNQPAANAVNAARPHRLARVLQLGWICCFGVAAWMSMLMIPFFPVIPDLDFSWTGALPYFAHRGFHFGTDVTFTYGPLGHFAGYAYTEYFSTARTVWELILKAIGAVLCCWALSELPLVIRLILAACIILFLGNFEESYSFMIILPALLLLRTTRQRPALHALLGLFLAVLALVKFVYFIQAACAIGAVTAYCVVERRWRASISLPAGFLIGLLVGWELSGQRIDHFISYVARSLAITEGYTAAMFTPTSTAAIWVALALGIFFVAQLILFSFQNDKARLVFGSLFLVVMLFILWKHAFTRWENHAQRFFLFFPELLLASWLLNKNAGRPTRFSIALTLMAIVCALIGAENVQPEVVSGALTRSRDQFRFAYSILTNYRELDLGRQTRLQEARSKFALPRIKAVVGDRTVDVFGYCQGIALLNELNYVPRPVFQGYSAYTPSLISLNTQHYQSSSRPEFVLSQLDTIDQRFPTLDDGKVLLELIYHYQPILNEKGWQLWQAAQVTQPLTPKLTETVTAKLDQEIPIPEGGPIWMELEVRATDWGRIRAFLYKSVPLMIELGDDTGQLFQYRIIPEMATSGFLLNPEMTNHDQLLLAANGAPLPKYKWLKITATPGAKMFKTTVKITLSTLPELGGRQGNAL